MKSCQMQRKFALPFSLSQDFHEHPSSYTVDIE